MTAYPLALLAAVSLCVSGAAWLVLRLADESRPRLADALLGLAWMGLLGAVVGFGSAIVVDGNARQVEWQARETWTVAHLKDTYGVEVVNPRELRDHAYGQNLSRVTGLLLRDGGRARLCDIQTVFDGDGGGDYTDVIAFCGDDATELPRR